MELFSHISVFPLKEATMMQFKHFYQKELGQKKKFRFEKKFRCEEP